MGILSREERKMAQIIASIERMEKKSSNHTAVSPSNKVMSSVSRKTASSPEKKRKVVKKRKLKTTAASRNSKNVKQKTTTTHNNNTKMTKLPPKKRWVAAYEARERLSIVKETVEDIIKQVVTISHVATEVVKNAVEKQTSISKEIQITIPSSSTTNDVSPSSDKRFHSPLPITAATAAASSTIVAATCSIQPEKSIL